ncbi:MAG: Alkyl hydroperoxide reductase subunit C [Alphaproteobacteria bacterium MarineAlpha5_Bin6]|nr:MAG: Alkyl hydroperoxide reductase subunit C [Alphaproteobacteria bacterium MarineAlpha5_Bin7]PPR52978.1 MAG: Alkyl hydroperoxide reductase subunit C [Alphaproteobacteria bacterium MarineAlpha5_Bin6]
MSLRINDVAPDFKAKSTVGEISFHEWIGDGWGVLFSHPRYKTPVCSTELGEVEKLKSEFEKRNVKVMGLSVDTIDETSSWLDDINDIAGAKPSFPIIADTDMNVSKLYNMLPTSEDGSSEGRTALDNETVRTVFIVGPDKKIKLYLTYPMTTGRNFNEIIRVIDSMQLTSSHPVATPVNWQKGEDVIIKPSVKNDEAKKIFPDGWNEIKPYLRKVSDPSK